MATAFTEFTCLGTDLLTTIQTAILASSDWARPNAGSYPSLFKATTTRGASMIVDFNDTAATVAVLNLGVYKAHDGTTGTGKLLRYLPIKKTVTGTLSANTYRGTVSAGKEHLFVAIEGPRAGEANADNASYGSVRTYFAMCDVVPYFDSTTDPTPVVACMSWWANQTAASTLANNSHMINVSSNPAGTATWTAAKMATLAFPMNNITDAIGFNWTGVDGNLYLSPYVVFEDSSGMRGRLSSFFFGGFNVVSNYESSPNATNSTVTYSGKNYKLLPVNKSDSTSAVWGPFGATSTSTAADSTRSVLVAVPMN